MKRLLLPLAFFATLLTGCLNYQLGTTLPANLRQVHVPSVANTSPEPGVDAVATSAVMREIQREGTLKLTPKHSATTQLDITIVKFALEPVHYRRHDTRTPDEYRAVVTAEVHFTEMGSDKLLYSSAIEGESVFPSGSDFVSAKQDELPKACEDLARKIVDRCISVW